jgi:hypothetical protein
MGGRLPVRTPAAKKESHDQEDYNPDERNNEKDLNDQVYWRKSGLFEREDHGQILRFFERGSSAANSSKNKGSSEHGRTCGRYPGTI